MDNLRELIRTIIITEIKKVLQEQARKEPGHAKCEYEKKKHKIEWAGFANSTDPSSGNKGFFIEK